MSSNIDKAKTNRASVVKLARRMEVIFEKERLCRTERKSVYDEAVKLGVNKLAFKFAMGMKLKSAEKLIEDAEIATITQMYMEYLSEAGLLNTEAQHTFKAPQVPEPIQTELPQHITRRPDGQRYLT